MKPKKQQSKFIRHLEYLHPEDVVKAKVVAIIYRRNKIIAYGFNRRSMSYTTVRHINQRRAWWTIHAEDAALRKAGARAKGSEMLVVRIMKDGSFGNAAPCFTCQFLIGKAGIKLPVRHT